MSHTERVMYLNEALEAPDVGELPSKEAAAQYGGKAADITSANPHIAVMTNARLQHWRRHLNRTRTGTTPIWSKS